MFDFFEFPLVGTRITPLGSKNAVTEGCVRGKESILPHITYVFTMHRVVRREVLEFIRPGETKKWIILGESCQDFLNFLRYTRLKCKFVNIVNDVLTEGIKLGIKL